MHPEADSSCSVQDVVDLQQVPPMETVCESDDFDASDSDNESLATDESASTPSATSVSFTKTGTTARRPSAASQQPPSEAPRATRRTRGMSFLPVRQSTNGTPQYLTSPTGTSPPPPTTPSPLRPLASYGSGSRSSEGKAPGPYRRSQPGTPTVNSDTNGNLLAAYMNQLAAKEARVVDLRSTMARLQQELKDAESDLAAYKDNGKKLAALVNSQDGGKLTVLKPNGGPGEQKDVLGMGRRVVDEIGTQFWSFLEDVKSATMGNADFPVQGAGGSSVRIPESIPRSPSPQRQLSPKRSIQDFLKNRSHSPIRRVRSPANAQERQRMAEHHASQRLRESERLTKKLSHIDLRAPSPSRTQPDSRNGASEP